MIELIFCCLVYVCLLDCVVCILVVCDYSEQELRCKFVVLIMGKNGLEEIDVMVEDYECVIVWCYEYGYFDDS